MKNKFIAALCVAVLSCSLLAGCGSSKATLSSVTAATTDAPASAATSEVPAAATSEAPTAAASEAAAEATSVEVSEPVDVNIAALKGPTAMGMVEFMNNADSGELTDNSYNFTIYESPDEVSPLLVQGKADIAAVPGNLASVLYNKTNGGVKVIAINTLGVLYIVDNGKTVSSIADLKGRTIYASGKGSTPEYVLNYILEQNGLDPAKDVTIEWKSEHAEALSSLLADPDAVALLPQPFATVAKAKADTINIDLDLTKEWDTIQADSETPSALVMGVAVARTDFINEHPDVVESFLQHYSDSVNYVNDEATLDDAASLVGKYGIVDEAVAKKALPQCNITFITGDEMKEKLQGFLQVLYDQDKTAVGGTLPGDDFYY